MGEDVKIATEIIQRITASQAKEYRLVPYAWAEGKLLCYGEQGMDWQSLLPEVEVLTGESIEVEPVAQEEISKLLNRYYRGSAQSNSKRSLSASGDRFLMRLIEEAFRSYASDIHFECYEERCRVRFRMDGQLIERYVIEKQNYPAIINQIKILSNLDISEKRLPQDGRIFYNSQSEKFDVRVSCLPTIYGEKVVLRLLTRHVELLELPNLGFSGKQMEDYLWAIRNPHGLILISGPTGSGKSTTLYATLRLLNSEKDNILTIEDPVEYTLEGVNQVQLKEEIGLTFGSALRTFLRQDPDIIMLGEIRDTDTAQMAIRSSLTGHLIFSTIHTNSAWGSVSRLVDMGLHPYLISNTLIMCVAQRLLRLLCPRCKEKVPLDDETRRLAGIGTRTTTAQEAGTGEQQGIAAAQPEFYYKPVGCDHCYHTGYRGRKAIYEVIPVDAELSEAIRSSRGDISAELAARGIVTLAQSATRLFEQGLISLAELIPQIQQ